MCLEGKKKINKIEKKKEVKENGEGSDMGDGGGFGEKQGKSAFSVSAAAAEPELAGVTADLGGKAVEEGGGSGHLLGGF